VPQGVRCLFNVDEKPTVDKFVTKTTMQGVTGNRPFQWADLTREELFSIFVLPKQDKLSADVALGMSWFAVELGLGNQATTLLDRAFAGGVQVAPDEETALRREIAAIKAYETLRGKLTGDGAEALAGVVLWREQFAGTDFYVLMDGRAAKDEQVFKDDVIAKFLENLGYK